MTDPPEPILAFRFRGPEGRPLTEYTELQMSVMPVVGVANGILTPLATCFCIATGAPLVITAWHVIREFVDHNRAELEAGTCHIDAVWETDEPVPGTDLDLGRRARCQQSWDGLRPRDPSPFR